MKFRSKDKSTEVFDYLIHNTIRMISSRLKEKFGLNTLRLLTLTVRPVQREGNHNETCLIYILRCLVHRVTM